MLKTSDVAGESRREKFESGHRSPRKIKYNVQKYFKAVSLKIQSIGKYYGPSLL